jgi:hypothetical protein
VAKLLHFTKKRREAHGPPEFIYISEGDGKETVAEYEEAGYELASSAELDDDELGGMPTERELTP